MNKYKLAELFRFMADEIENDDSFEGRVEYHVMPGLIWEYYVDAFVRGGNNSGQGGAVVIQQMDGYDPDMGLKDNCELVESTNEENHDG
jgi:hypothetical protein